MQGLEFQAGIKLSATLVAAQTMATAMEEDSNSTRYPPMLTTETSTRCHPPTRDRRWILAASHRETPLPERIPGVRCSVETRTGRDPATAQAVKEILRRAREIEEAGRLDIRLASLAFLIPRDKECLRHGHDFLNNLQLLAVNFYSRATEILLPLFMTENITK